MADVCCERRVPVPALLLARTVVDLLCPLAQLFAAALPANGGIAVLEPLYLDREEAIVLFTAKRLELSDARIVVSHIRRV